MVRIIPLHGIGRKFESYRDYILKGEDMSHTCRKLVREIKLNKEEGLRLAIKALKTRDCFKIICEEYPGLNNSYKLLAVLEAIR